MAKSLTFCAGRDSRDGQRGQGHSANRTAEAGTEAQQEEPRGGHGDRAILRDAGQFLRGHHERAVAGRRGDPGERAVRPGRRDGGQGPPGGGGADDGLGLRGGELPVLAKRLGAGEGQRHVVPGQGGQPGGMIVRGPAGMDHAGQGEHHRQGGRHPGGGGQGRGPGPRGPGPRRRSSRSLPAAVREREGGPAAGRQPERRDRAGRDLSGLGADGVPDPVLERGHGASPRARHGVSFRARPSASSARNAVDRTVPGRIPITRPICSSGSSA